MPEYNAIQTARLESWVRKLLGVRNGGILPNVAPELGVAVNFPVYADADAPAGYLPWGFYESSAPVAAQYSWVSLVNSSASSLLLVRWHVAPLAADTIYLEMGPGLAGALIAPAQVGWRDSRRSQATFPLTSIVTIASGAGAAGPLFAAHFAVGRLVVPVDSRAFPWLVLPPGTGTIVVGGTVNNGIVASGECYMREMLPDELNI